MPQSTTRSYERWRRSALSQITDFVEKFRGWSVTNMQTASLALAARFSAAARGRATCPVQPGSEAQTVGSCQVELETMGSRIEPFAEIGVAGVRAVQEQVF